jgi:filamentous hemagglutinin family protein
MPSLRRSNAKSISIVALRHNDLPLALDRFGGRCRLPASFATMTAVAALMVLSRPVFAGPTGGSVVEGSAGISQAGNTTNINQSSNKAIINWRGFSVGAQETVNFNQPNVSSVTLNRVIGNETSIISGALNANGQVFIVNSAGVLFSKGAQVNVGGLVASTLDIANANFMAGKYTFSGNSSASIVNKGKIRANGGGYVALLGQTVANDGVIVANLGTVAMASGQQISLNFGGNSLVDVTIDKGALNALVSNKRAIIANGGQVIMTAKAADEVLSAQVNNSGIIQARTMAALTGGTGTQTAARKGSIKLLADGGTVNVAGKLDVSAKRGRPGGTIIATGTNVNLTSTARLDASGDTGGIILVGGDRHGGSNSSENFVGETVANATTTTVAAGATLTANGSTGNGGHIVIWSNDRTDYAGKIAATGAGAGQGGFAEVSSHGVLGFTGTADLRSANGAVGTLLLDPYDVVISNGANANGGFDDQTPTNTYTPTGASIIDVAALQNALSTANVTITTTGVGTDAGNITVNAPVSWSANTLTLSATSNVYVNAVMTATGTASFAANWGTGTNADGSPNSMYMAMGQTNGVNNGTFAGRLDFGSTGTLTLNNQVYTVINSISDLVTITTNDANNSGTFSAQIFAPLADGHYALGSNLDATGYDTGSNFLASGYAAIPGLSGVLDGLGHTINHLQISDSATGFDGLVANNFGGVIRNIGMVDATVNGYRYTGTLVGLNEGTVLNSFASGGTVAALFDQVGGLVGNNSGLIANSWSNLSVSGNNEVGGLAGRNQVDDFVVPTVVGTIINSYASGAVNAYPASGSPRHSYGGLVGYNYGGSIQNSYATGDVLSPLQSNGTTILNSSDGPMDLYYVGGLVGQSVNYGGPPVFVSVIENSHATGSVAGGTGGFIGGLVGLGQGTIDQSYATGAVNSTAGSNVGGLVGQTLIGTSVTNSYATGAVTAPNSGNVGGLIGWNSSTVSNSYASGDVTGGLAVGGLVGLNGGNIDSSHASGKVSGGAEQTGGLVGTNGTGAAGSTATISNSYASGDVNGGSEVGGLVGYNWSGGVIQNSTASGNVTGQDGVGGLVGFNDWGVQGGAPGKITGSLSTGDVNGATNTGGLVGINSGIVDSSNATGSVNHGNGPEGLFGSNAFTNAGITHNGTVTNSFYHDVKAEARAAQQAAEALAAQQAAEARAAQQAAAQAAARTGNVIASDAATLAATSPDPAISTAGTQATTSASSSRLEENAKTIDDNIKAEEKQLRARRQAAATTTRSVGAGRRGPGYGATIRSIDVDGQRYNLQDGGSNKKGAPGQ